MDLYHPSDKHPAPLCRFNPGDVVSLNGITYLITDQEDGAGRTKTIVLKTGRGVWLDDMVSVHREFGYFHRLQHTE